MQTVYAFMANFRKEREIKEIEKNVKKLPTTYKGRIESTQIRLQSLKERSYMHTELKVEGITAAEHKDGDITRVGDKDIGDRE